MPTNAKTFRCRFILVAAFAALLLCLLPASAQKAYAAKMTETVNGVEFAYYIADDTAYLAANKPKYSGDIVIPSRLGGYPVVSIYQSAFSGCGSLKSVTIPDTVIYIGDWAFKGCTALKSITLPNSVRNIGQSTFEGCVQLKSITLPKSVKDVHLMAFDNCTSLREILVDPQNPCYCSFNGILCSKGMYCAYICPLGFTGKSVTFPAALQVVEDEAFQGCASLESVTFESTGGMEINGDAFANCSSLKSVVIKGYVQSIDPGAFQDCASLEALAIHGNRACIKWDAFKGCTNLRKVYFGGRQSVWNSDVDSMGNECLLTASISFGSEDHIGKLVPGKPATCELDGIKDYYVCAGMYFSDPDARNRIANLNAWKVIPALGHSFKSTVKKATFAKDGSIAFKCSRCKATKPRVAIPRIKTVKLSKATYAYSGKAKSPYMVIKDAKGKIISSKYYTVSKPKGRTSVGSYVYKVTFKGNYSGSKSLTMKVVPKGTSVSSLKALSKAVDVKWKKQTIKMPSKRVTGYEVRYSLKSNMASAKTVKVKGYSKGNAKLTKLKGNRAYYVQVRTCMNVDGKAYFSAWSAKKSVKTR